MSAAPRHRDRRPPRAPVAHPLAENRVAITSIAAGGDGVGRADGRVLFVPRTAPGDVVDVAFSADPSARFAHAQLVRLVERGPARVAAECPHYDADACGGCQLQHLAYDAQLDAKATIIADAFARIARRPLAAIPRVRPSPSPWRYRRKLSLHLRRTGDQAIAGLHPHHDPAAVFPLVDCRIASVAINAACREIVAASRALPSADGLRLTVREAEGGATLVVEGGRAWHEPAALLDHAPSLVAIWWQPQEGVRRLVADRRPADEPGASFLQVNAAMARELHAHVVALVMAHAPATVVDAYAGAGDTALALAALGVRVTAIELDPEAARYCAVRLPAGSRAVAARVEAELPRAVPADAVVVNPPRDGLPSTVTGALDAEHARARTVVYVSCNPATLARDVARLPHWRVASCAAFDMFPQTAHVETVCELVPEGR